MRDRRLQSLIRRCRLATRIPLYYHYRRRDGGLFDLFVLFYFARLTGYKERDAHFQVRIYATAKRHLSIP